MTQLFNLESYIDCHQYALLFKESQEDILPKINQLPYNYKSFIQKYASLLCTPNIITNEASPQELVIESNQCNYISIGSTLAPGDKQQLFIIRDTVDLMTLSTSNLFTRQDGYLYSSAYHYWNNYSALSQLDKPLVFIDLDSCLPSELIPVDITSNKNTNYKIPILNTGKRFRLDLEFNSEETYQAIYAVIAHWILENNFPAIAQNQEAVSHLIQYLQKISFFRSIQPYVNQDSFEIIVEILHQDRVFYKKVILYAQAIANIIESQIKVDLNQLALKYPHYQFVLVSQYNIFPEVYKLLPFICPNPIDQQFNEIWQARNQLKFPLFGLYLDKIEFAISVSDKIGKRHEQWIQLSSQKDTISFEGKPTILIGNIPDTNQNVFRISSQVTSILPIKVNGAEYCRNGIPQGYSIKVVDAHHTADVSIKIEFHLQPGSFPELRVTDIEGKYKFVTSLVDRKKSNYNHISPEKINSDRQQKSINQIKRFQESTQLEELKKILVAIATEFPPSS